MTYENWCKYSAKILAEAEKYNKWADESKGFLLTKIGPKLEKLRKSGYMGCGFHYGLEQTFGRLFDKLALPWQPSANWCQNVENDRTSAIISKVIFKSLVDQVKDAEKSGIKAYGIGINSRYVENSFKRYKVIEDVSQLANELTKIFNENAGKRIR